MFKLIFIIFLSILSSFANANMKEKIIENLKNTENFDFDFEQNINGKIEIGSCTIKYPKKIFCEYAKSNNKILVSDGRYLVVKTRSSYYQYPLKKTPLNLLLDKDFLLSEIINSEEKIVNDKYYNFSLKNKDHKINIFFDKDSNELVGWQTEDLYQNLAVTYIYNIKKNSKIDKKIFRLP